MYSKRENLSLAEVFSKYFSVSLATTPEQKLSVYKIRYRVYCEELLFLDPEDRPQEEYRAGIEIDEFDERSVHCLVTHKRTGKPAGCVRLVTTSGSFLDEPLPMEKYCLPSLSINALEMLTKDRCRVGEISRLAVDPCFRRRCGERYKEYGNVDAFDFNHQEKRTFSLIGVAGLIASAAVAELMGINEVFAMMDPALPRLMRRSGFYFDQVGEVTYYHGKRAPYHINSYAYHKGMPEQLKGFYCDLYDRFKSHYDNPAITAMSVNSL